jgi:hypothetical protein
MKIRHVLGPLPLILLLANTAFGQDEAIRQPLSLNWGVPVEKRPRLTLLDEKWFPPFDDKLILLGKDAGERGAETAMAQAPVVGAEDWKSRPYLADRGDGIHTSLFGTYVRKNEFLVYLFYEYTRNRDAEYKPSEFGFASDRDFRAKKEEHEFLIFASYAFTDSLMIELESALYTYASQSRASGDTSGMPRLFSESGVGDTEGQIRYRWFEETEVRPELLSYVGVVFPLQPNKKLIGTQDWEFSAGVNITKGFPFGTFMVKIGAFYSTGEGKLELGEYGIEYVKRLSDKWRLVAAVEGDQDEVQAILEVQYQVRPNITIKLNSGFGLTSKAPEFAPEIGVLFSF